jgi:hypothetical protein
MQASHQSQAFRIVNYFRDKEIRSRVFPGIQFALEAQEIGPLTKGGHEGPCIILFTHLELHPTSVLEWFSGDSLLKRHVTRLYFLQGIDGRGAEIALSENGLEEEAGHPAKAKRQRKCREQLLEEIISSLQGSGSEGNPQVISSKIL